MIKRAHPPFWTSVSGRGGAFLCIEGGRDPPTLRSGEGGVNTKLSLLGTALTLQEGIGLPRGFIAAEQQLSEAQGIVERLTGCGER